METPYDLVIVGGGMAGMTAAIYAAKANLRTIVLEKEICGGLANFTHSVENFPSYPRIHGMELMEKVKGQVEGLGVRVEEISDVTTVDFGSGHKQVVAADHTYTADSVILATGRIPVRLPVETDWDEHIHYCSVCDGAAYKGKDLVVVGGGNSGFDECLYLIDLGVRSIRILEAAEACPAAAATQARALKTGRISVRTGMQICAVGGGRDGGRIDVRDGRTGAAEEIRADGVFVFMGQRPNTRMLTGVVALDPAGYILTDEGMATSRPGVFAAGDVVAKKYRQLTTAMADGTIAALEAVHYVRERAAIGSADAQNHHLG